MNATAEPVDLAAIAARLEDITARLDRMERRQRAVSDLVEEMTPIAKEMMGVGGAHLGDLESRGYFAFVKQMMRIVDNVVTAYDEDDLKQLGDNVVRIVDTVKNVTQPDILAIANEATNAIHDADSAEPKSVLGMLTSTRDKDVKKGMAVMVQVLKHVGRAASTMGKPVGSKRQRRLAASLAPRREVPRLPAPEAPKAAPRPAPAAAAPVAPVVTVAGFAMTDEGFLVDHTTWTEGFATQLAASMNLELTEQHWALIRFVREDYETSGSSPNVRRIGKSSPVSTKELYGMFPAAPAIYAARLAGLPKPAGCI